MSVRTFLALPLAPYFESDLSKCHAELKLKYPEIRWIPPTEIHVTMHFFGAIEEAEIAAISRSIEPLTHKAKSLRLNLEGLGAFPDLSRPRVIWMGLGGDTEPLKILREKIEERLKQNGYSCEEREFKPHATIGRTKNEVKGGFKIINFDPSTPRTVNELVLFKSHLGPQGAHYEAISTYPFAPA